MKYYSTRDKSKSHPFNLADAAFAGLAPDGGLFMPECIPVVDMARVEAEPDKIYADAALMADHVAKYHTWDSIASQYVDYLHKI